MMKHHFRVKVCGVTRSEDAQYAEKLGADYIGMIFYRKSPRFLTQSKAKSLCKALMPTTQLVGVFVDQSKEQIIKIAMDLKLSLVQLHGTYTNRDIGYCQKYGFRVIKAFHLLKKSDYQKAMQSHADIVMIDNAGVNLPGGSGHSFDWSLLPKGKIQNLVLAGGINSSNVADGVKRFRPLIVDVNSGVEKAPGIKSGRLMKQFFEKCDRLRYE